MSSTSTTRDAHGQPLRLFQRANNGARAVDQLVGICTGLLADGEVSEREAIFFAEWVRRHAPEEPLWPFTDVLQRLERIFADGVCDAEDRAELQGVMQALCGYADEALPQDETRSTTLPLCLPPPAVVFADQQFVATGKFAYGARSAVFDAISALGGMPTDAAPAHATQPTPPGTWSSARLAAATG